MSVCPANMRNCDRKKKCLFGPNQGIAYNPKDPCCGAGTFDEETCDCSAQHGCWHIQATNSGKDVVPEKESLEFWQSVPKKGEVGELSWRPGMLADPGSSFPQSGFNHTPNSQECTSEDVTNNTCDYSPLFLPEYNGSGTTCVTSARLSEGGPAGFEFVVRGEGGATEARSAIWAGVRGDGTDHCTTSTVSMELEPRIPRGQPCGNPFRIYCRVVQTSFSEFKFIDGQNELQPCDPDYCGAGNFIWQGSYADFIEIKETPTLDFFYNGDGTYGKSCSLVQGGAVVQFNIKTYWDPDITTGNDPFATGQIVDTDETGESSLIRQAYGNTGFGSPVAERIDVFMGPSEIPGWDQSDVEPPEGFELLASYVNDEENIWCSAGFDL